MFKWLKKNVKSLLLTASLLLNALGGTGVIPPVAAGKAGQVIDALGKVAP